MYVRSLYVTIASSFIYYLLSLIPDIRPPARRGYAPPYGLGVAFAPGVRRAINRNQWNS